MTVPTLVLTSPVLDTLLTSGRDATLFAGCGIVADSDPEREWEESRMKLRPIVSALGREPEPAA